MLIAFCRFVKQALFLTGSCNIIDESIQQQQQTKDVLAMEEYENVLIVSVLCQIFVITTTVYILDLVLCILYFMVCSNKGSCL